jgi:hypothetical protein
MPSRLLDIYNALAALPVTVGAVSVLGLTPALYRSKPASFPIRILTPLSDASEGREGARFSMAGASFAMQWRVVDLLLWRAASQGAGIETYMDDLLSYQVAYVSVIAAQRKIADAIIENLSMDVGIYSYPAESGKDYFGVKCELVIKEIFK